MRAIPALTGCQVGDGHARRHDELPGQRAAVVMSLVQSAKLSEHDPWAHLTDVLTRLRSHPNCRIDELLPHCWSPLT